MPVHDDSKDPTPQAQPAKPTTVMGDALQSVGITPASYTSTAPQSTQTQQSTTQEPRMSQTQEAAPSPFNINDLLRRPVSRHPAGEKVQAYVKQLKKLADEAISDTNLRQATSFEVLDANSDQVLMSTILVTMYVNDPKLGNIAGVFELVVEDESQKLPDLIQNYGQGQIVIKRTTGDVADNELWDKARNALIQRAGVKQVFFAGSDVIPASLAADDEFHLRKVLFSATQAITTVLEEEVLGDQPGIALPSLVANAALSVALGYADGDTETATGLPVRSNLSVTMKAGEKNQPTGPNASVHRKQVELTRVDGYVDLILTPPGPPAYGQQQKTQSFIPRFNITRMDSSFDAITLESQLLALASAFTAGYQWAWAGSFLPRFASSAMRSGNSAGKKQLELRDLGAIGLEIPLDASGELKRTSILSSKTEDRDVQALVQYAFDERIVFTLHVPEVGDLAWIQEVFVAAARGNQRAYDRIVAAANTLTGGEFGRRWATHTAQGALNPIAFDDKGRLPVGYFNDPNDATRRHDIREIDYLAMLNAVGDKDMGQVRRWQQAIDNVGISTEKRTEEIIKMLDDVIGVGRYTITGYVTPITLAGDFLRILNESAAAAGADIRPTNLVTDFTGASGRVLYNAAQAAIAPGQLAGIFNTGPGVGPGRGYVSNVHSRY